MKILVALSVLSEVCAWGAPRAVPVGETPWRPWERFRVERGAGGDLDVYVARDGVRRPLLVMLPGSHCVPLFAVSGRRHRSTLIFGEAAEEATRRVHFAAVERPHLRSFGPIVDGEDRCTPEHGGVSKEERVRDAADAVRALAAEPWVGEVLLVGHSEGADVAAGAAHELGDGSVAAVGFFSSGGSSQLFDHVIEARRDGGEEEVQGVFEELLALTGPAPPAEYRGFPVERYRSYALRSTPLDDLAGRKVPVFIAQGTRDRNSPVETADLLAVELLRRDGDRAVKYLRLPGLDHGYAAADGTPHEQEVLKAFLDWALAPVRARGVERWPEAPAVPRRVIRRYVGIEEKYWIYLGLAAAVAIAGWRVRRRIARGGVIGT
jgi:pimeloyl-ACP methyl ester carboxylesterase